MLSIARAQDGSLSVYLTNSQKSTARKKHKITDKIVPNFIPKIFFFIFDSEKSIVVVVALVLQKLLDEEFTQGLGCKVTLKLTFLGYRNDARLL